MTVTIFLERRNIKMKKTLRIVAIAMVAVILCLSLASCGKKLSGEYYFGDKSITKTYTTYEFSGSKVSVEAYVLGQKVGDDSFEGKYSIKDGDITITWKDSDGEEQSSTQAFEELEDGSIKIGAITYKKAEK